MRNRRNLPENLFFAVAGINIIIMLVMLVVTEGYALKAMSYTESTMCDFWVHINRLLNYDVLYGNLADADAIFPPLAYCFLNFFAQFLRLKGKDMSMEELATSGHGILVLTIYFVFFAVLFAQLIQYCYRASIVKKNVLILFLFASYPFWAYAFERGNPVIWSMLFLLCGLVWMNHEKAIYREIALICIAVSAGFKIYPAVFGVLYLISKRYKEAIRLVIYGIIAFFMPFFCFGSNALAEYIGTFGRYLNKGSYSITSIVGCCIEMLGESGAFIGKILVVLWLVWTLVYLVTEKKVTWKTLAMLTSICTLILAESYLYTYVFVVIPLIFFLNELKEKEQMQRLDCVYAVLFAAVFTFPPLNLDKMTANGKWMFAAWVIILMMISIEKFIKFFKKPMLKAD